MEREGGTEGGRGREENFPHELASALQVNIFQDYNEQKKLWLLNAIYLFSLIFSSSHSCAEIKMNAQSDYLAPFKGVVQTSQIIIFYSLYHIKPDGEGLCYIF